MKRSQNIKDVLQIYGNQQRLDVLNKKIKAMKKKENYNFDELLDIISLYHETLEHIINALECAVFSENFE